MTVAELIVELQKLPQDAVVCCDDNDYERGIGEYTLTGPITTTTLYRQPGGPRYPRDLEYWESPRMSGFDVPVTAVVLK